LPVEELESALTVVNNWRSSHGRPLQSIKMTLLMRARSLDRRALIAQRIKRLRAIKVKLNRPENNHMKLSQMHDLGGCRAVMRTVSQVELLGEKYKEQSTKNRFRGGEAVKTYDYITTPKDDGYRGIHLVRKYHSEYPSSWLREFDGLRIEIQIRSKLQHAWATAVEAVDFYTGQALKSNLGQERWKRFFALSSCAFAGLEKRPLIPNTPTDRKDLREELMSFSNELSLIEGLSFATEITQKREGHFFLLELDLNKASIRTTAFSEERLQEANEAYLNAEKRITDDPRFQAVLVSVDGLSELRKAYPNFFLDIKEFLSELGKFLHPSKHPEQLGLGLDQ
jgi:ppGpp synthetase/RelA/SpoT-type nucleotidyltranferase